MIEELNLNCPYKVYADTSANFYTFTTDNLIDYRVSFSEANYLFDGTIGEGILQNTYFLSIENASPFTAKTDEKVKITVSKILQKFFENTENCIIYICDSSDKREYARFRKFNHWFETENKNFKIKKLNEIFGIDEDTNHYTTMIYHTDNPLSEVLLQAYHQIIQNLKK